MPLSSKKKKDKKQNKKQNKDQLPDAILEQTEKPMTTTHCPQSLNEKQLSDVKKYPEKYIEINLINKNRMVDNFYIKITHNTFKYKTKKYKIDEKKIYLLPTKSGFFMLTSFYKEGDNNPKSFKKTNKGITSKALSLLYNENLYLDMFSPDETKYNFIIAIVSIINACLFTAGLYVQYKGGV